MIIRKTLAAGALITATYGPTTARRAAEHPTLRVAALIRPARPTRTAKCGERSPIRTGCPGSGRSWLREGDDDLGGRHHL